MHLKVPEKLEEFQVLKGAETSHQKLIEYVPSTDLQLDCKKLLMNSNIQ